MYVIDNNVYGYETPRMSTFFLLLLLLMFPVISQQPKNMKQAFIIKATCMEPQTLRKLTRC